MHTFHAGRPRAGGAPAVVPSMPPALGLGLFLFIAGLVGCGAKNEFVAPPPPQVTVAKPIMRPVRETIDFIGETRAFAMVDIRSRVSGYLTKIFFDDGAIVAQGDPLFEIDQAPYKIALSLAKANRDKAAAARTLAEIEYQRATELLERSAITKAEHDSRKAELDTASATVAAAEADVQQAELNLSYTTISSPLSGRISRRMADVGNLIQAEQTSLGTIESVDPIYAYFNVSERDLLRYMAMVRDKKVPDPTVDPPTLYLGLANEEGYPHEGKLDYQAFGLESDTGTQIRRGVFPNPDKGLIPGLFVRIRGYLGDPEPRLLVEERAVSSDQRGEYLLVVNDKNIVEVRPVTLGIPDDGLVVIQSGLGENEQVVVNGLQRARPGAPVAPQPGEMTSASQRSAAAVQAKAAASQGPPAGAGSAPAGASATDASTPATSTPAATPESKASESSKTASEPASPQSK